MWTPLVQAPLGEAGPGNVQRARGRLRVGLRRFGQLTERSLTEFFADRGTQLAAAISYYALFALFPLMILSVVVYGSIVGQQDAHRQIVELLTEAVPVIEGSRGELEVAVAGVADHVGAFSAFGIAGLVFSASGLMGAVRNAVNTAWGVEQRRPPLQGKLFDILLVMAAAPAIALATVASFADRLAPGGFVGVGIVTRALPIVLAALVFAVIYRVMPATEVGWRDVWPGALVAALGYEVAKVGFGLYLENFNRYDDVYGSLAGVVVLLFFVFIAANAFLLGAEVASEWPEVRAGRGDGPGSDQESTTARLRKMLRGLVVAESQPR